MREAGQHREAPVHLSEYAHALLARTHGHHHKHPRLNSHRMPLTLGLAGFGLAGFIAVMPHPTFLTPAASAGTSAYLPGVPAQDASHILVRGSARVRSAAAVRVSQAIARAEAARDRRQARREAQREAAALARRQARAAARQAYRASLVTSPPPAPSGSWQGSSVLSPAQIGSLWLDAGGSAATEATAVCIAGFESGGNTQAVSATNDYGVWQINNDPAALNPQVNARTAVSMSSDGTDWSAWTTHADCGV